MSIEASGGAAFTTQKFGDADLGTGVGLELIGRYRFMPHLAVYAGWDWRWLPVSARNGGSARHRPVFHPVA